MFVISLQSLAEQAVLGATREQRLSGNIADIDLLFDAGNLEKLEAQVDAFGFLAFDPRVDQACLDYLAQATLATDSGSRILVLFTTASPAPVPAPLDLRGLTWLDLRAEELPAQEMLRHLFHPDSPPAMPGVAFLRAFSSGDETIYFPLGDCTTAAEIRTRMRQILPAVARAATDDPGGREFVNRLAVRSQLERLDFRRAGVRSPRQWLISGYRSVRENAGDLVAAIGLFT